VTCDEVSELLGAYVLEAVDDTERRAIDDHLRTCGQHSELASLRAAVRGLNAAALERTPPPALRKRILQAASGAESPPASREGRVRRLWSKVGNPRYAMAALAASLILGLIGWNVVLHAQLHDVSQSPVERFYRGGEGEWIRVETLAGTTNTTISCGGLQPLSSGEVYALWRIRNGQNQEIATFSLPGTDRWTAHVPIPLEHGDMIALTVEPIGGSTTPAKNPVMKVLI